MKRILAIALSIIMVFSLCACGNNKKAEKYCWSCGEGISKDVAFCEHCGAAVNNEKNESEDASSDNSSSTESKTEETSKPSSTTENASKPTTSGKPSTPAHTHNYSKKVTAATCTEKGYTTYTCSCGYSYKDNCTEPSHTYSKYKCTKCGQLDKAHTYEILVDWILENGENTGDCCVVEREDSAAIIYQKASNEVILQWSYFDMVIEEEGKVQIFYVIIPQKLTGKYYFAGDYGENFQREFEFNGYLNPKTFTKDSPMTFDKLIIYTNDSREVTMKALKVMYVEILENIDAMLSGEYEGLIDSGLSIEDLGFTSLT